MKYCNFEYKYHADMVRWWPAKHDFPLPGEDFLPDIGFIVDETACGFLYTTNSKLFFIEWVFANPQKDKELRTKALDQLFMLLQEKAHAMGAQAVLSASAIPAYSEVLERNRFKMTDNGISHYVKLLEENK